ncbi:MULTISPECIES: zinc-ribbon domain-containing protein [unclassified Kutzneria]|uniref:zinc-ribbon domain-containing protein n=1 Tax=unclassified Kutzneria TaxID=2621979 RepID=UPI0004B8394E|nr:zinc-ribbon domain-containing protein [Kutzneria sp. 744]
MLLIWGFRRYVQQLLMTMLVCNNCHNPAAHALRKFTTKFTFFFIPLFPVSNRYQLQCTYCGNVSELSKEQSLALVAQNETAAQQPAAQQLPQNLG